MDEGIFVQMRTIRESLWIELDRMQGSSESTDLVAVGGKSPATFDTMVRSWVHFDKLAATFVRQAQQARTARMRWETQILDNLRQTHRTDSIIQIGGGRLTVHDEKHAQPLTYGRLESLLHQYYAKKRPGSEDETMKLMEFLKQNRSYVLETRLKKS